MDQTREERLQQRLRGAQRREVTNVDFGFFLPPVPTAPVAEERSNNNSLPAPLPELPSQPATRRSPRAQNSRSSLNLRAVTPGTHDANISVKRRKLESEVLGPSSSARSRSSQPLPRPDVYDLPEDNAGPGLATEASQLSMNDASQTEIAEGAGTIVTEAPTQDIHDDAPAAVELNVAVPDEPVIAEVEPIVHVSRKKRKRGELVAKPSSQPQEPRRRSARGGRPSSIVDEVDDHSPEPKRKITKATAEQATAVAIDDIDELSPKPKAKRQKAAVKERLSAADELNELPSQPKRGRHKSVKKVIPDVVEAQADNEPAEEEDNVPEEAVAINDVEAAAINDVEAAAILKKNRGRRTSRGVPQVELSEEDPEPQAPLPKKQRGKQRAPLSPVQQRHPKPKQAKPPSKAKTSGARNNEAIRLGSPIPVTVHRFTKRPEYDDDESDADILNSEIPYVKRGGVNAVDVLSQFCQEIIDSALETLNNGAANTEDSALRREYKTKGRAIEEFGVEIQARLLDHTINIESGRALEKRVRDEQRRKLALREEILQIRAEREQVALRMDEIRIKHEEERKAADERNTLNNVVHDIEVAIDRGKAKEEPNYDVEQTGIELLLKRVAGEVSSKSDGGGILKQIKEFNSFLERTALALKA